MIHDFNCKDPDKMYYDEFKRRMKEIKETKEGKEIMCQALEKMVNKERIEGIKIGKFEDKKEIAKRMYDSKRYDIEDIVFVTGMDKEEVKELCYL